MDDGVALAALDCMAMPLLLLGPGAKIVHANRAAKRMLGAGRTFSAEGGVLTVQRSVDQDAIIDRIAITQRSRTPATLQMANRQGDVQHVLAFSPVPGALVAVAISELRAPLLLPPKWSQASLSLPPASAELAEALAGGENLAEFAERTGLSIGGARTRLKKLLRRLGVRSQSDLVAVLLRTAAALPVP